MKQHRWSTWMLPFVGLVSLVWFLLRVVPKPSRAAYPCQRVSAPLAGGFLLWLGGVVSSAFAYRKAKHLFLQSRRAPALALMAVVIGAGAIALIHMPERVLQATNPEPLSPLGVAIGLHPGRVVWVHDRTATNWVGPGSGHWWENDHTDQAAVDGMMSQAIHALGGVGGDAAAWDALIRSFNQSHGRGDIGYTPGEKICIKVNLVGCIASGTGVDPNSYDLVNKLDYMNTSPQMMRALLNQLVNVVGVNQPDISIGDPTCLFPNQYYNLLHDAFPNVHYLDHNGGNAGHPRTAVALSAVPIFWSARPVGKTPDYVPQAYVEATYLINLANLKSHTAAGVTLCAKNNYGSLKRYPMDAGYYVLHDTLSANVPEMGRYRCLVDLMGHAQIGGKTLLYFVDGLYAGVHPTEAAPRKWNSAPFNGDWTSSLFASQDAVAIDSVAFDFLWTEWADYPRMSGTDDYLHEAAQANNPPSGTFYDPDHAVNTTRLVSLGAHEHWNNATEKKYSRNLGTGDGIEMVLLRPQPGDFDRDGDVDQADFGRFQACLTGPGWSQTDPACESAQLDFDSSGDVDVDDDDFAIFQRCFSRPNNPADPNCAS